MRREPNRKGWSILLSLGVLLAAAAGRPMRTYAQDDDARSLFREGLQLADQERWGEAIVYFRRSRTLEDRPSTMFNLGVALLRAAQYNEALVVFEDFQRASDPVRDAESRAEVERFAAMARSSRARLELRVDPSAAVLSIDGQASDSTGATREIWLDPGRHVILVEAPGHTSRTLHLSFLPGEQTTTEVELIAGTHVEPVAATSAPSAEPVLDRATLEADTDAPGEDLWASPILWTVVAVVAVGAGVGIGLGVGLGSGGSESMPYGGNTGIVLRP
jgi:hypothetical protein